ncbi:type VI secretion system tip protein VgrG [Fluviicola sp.]|jgi:Rhs element Vgr protein|uniref:type VI secretion system tip protein VgrG n=1 Tax=Fluviicola sp. TaxID=1917219 RepID=UPI00282840FA|nr:type VI secretion system tip protein VgrG [Fluviicola sp.]MDR0802973.1 type VI secretion system tip protein VgrG [Fluviicola sp.]
MSVSPEKNSEGLVTWSIYSEGNKISDSFELVSILVRKEVNRIGRATLIFEAGDMPRKEIPESDDDTFAPGKKIRIEAGYQSNEKSIFEGIVVTHNLEIPENGSTTLQIECADYLLSATLSRKNKLFEQKKDSDIIKEILGTYPGLSISVDATTYTHPELVQYYASDWDFICSRADANGLLVISDGKTVKISKPNVSAAAVLNVTYGSDLISFRGELQTTGQTTGVDAYAWDIATQDMIKAASAKPTLNNQGDKTSAALSEAIGGDRQAIQTESYGDTSQLQAWADAQALRAGLARIRGEIKFQGSSLAVPGCLITLAGLGKRFNGDAYIGMVEHEITDGEWLTTAGMGIDLELATQNTDVVTPPASGLLPGIEGLHIGVVKKIDGDPEKEYRIQVEIPLLNSDKNIVWARLSNFWSSNNYGAFFIPYVGDEVVLGFLNNDPTYPVVLGSMYSSSNLSPLEIDTKNPKQFLQSKSGLKFELDDGNKIITVQTSASNKMVLSDKDKSISITDQNGNKIELSSSGILIEASKGVTIKSGTETSIQAGTNGNFNAKTSLTLKSVNIEASADAGFTAKGNATAELSAAGQTTVKGAIVMIN